jgi:hypothetical protein
MKADITKIQNWRGYSWKMAPGAVNNFWMVELWFSVIF